MRYKRKYLLTILAVILFSKCALISNLPTDGSDSNISLSSLLLIMNQNSEEGIELSGSIKNANGSMGSGVEIKISSSFGDSSTTSGLDGKWSLGLAKAQVPFKSIISIYSNNLEVAAFNINISGDSGTSLQTIISKLKGQLELTCEARFLSNNVTPHNLVISGEELLLNEGGEFRIIKLKLNKKPTITNTYIFSAHTWIYPKVKVGDYSRYLKQLSVVVDPPSLTFTKSNYEEEQEIRIKAIPDDNALDENGFLSVIFPGGLVADLNRVVKIKDSEAKRLFLTSSKFTSDMGGILGADNKCAEDTKKPTQGIFKAFLVTQLVAPLKRIACKTFACDTTDEKENWVLKPNTTYKRASDGVSVFDTDDQSLINEYTLRAFPDSEIHTENIEHSFWNGLSLKTSPSRDWRADEDSTTVPSTCNNWEGISWYVNGTIGNGGNLSGLFLTGGGGNCNTASGKFSYPSKHRLLCIEQ